MDSDELLALMAAQIYAGKCVAYFSTTTPKTKPRWDEFRTDAMRASIAEARELWAIVRQKREWPSG